MLFTRFLSISLLLASPLAWGFANKDVPSWVEEMASRKVPDYPGKVPAVVLLDEDHFTFDPSGNLTLTERHAVKILNQQGKRQASVAVPYWKNRRDVKDLHAWIVTPSGYQKTFDKNSVVDIGAFSESELYTDGRVRTISADNPEIGSVFAWEFTVQEKALSAQTVFGFAWRIPSLVSRLQVTLPAGWTPKPVFFNLPPSEPIVDGSTYTWELKNLPYREAEDESGDSEPRIAVSFLPAPGVTAATPAFASWQDVSRWQYSLVDGQDEVTPEIAAKVKELTSGAKTDYEKICAIGRYVQALRYVAIEMDLERGGGYIPHSADTVFAKQYGDCKDKANLMRCMLKAAGVSSYLVAIHSGNRTHVKEVWPSPAQFNHMIVAVKVSDSVTSAPVIDSGLGRLLIFDPTDPKTPVGDLPWYEQASYALVLAREKGDLAKMPVTAPEANGYNVTVDATLQPDGHLKASVVNSKTGQPASMERNRVADEKPDEYKSGYQQFVNNGAKGSTISQLTPEDHFEQNRFDVKFDFASVDYAQLMQNRLMVFNPAVVELPLSIAPEFPKTEKRTTPIVLRAALYRKTVHLKLPDGFVLDEPPVPSKYETDFGKFSLTFKPEPGGLLMTEELRTEAATIPAEQFDAVKKFFDNCRGADRQKAVLAKN